MSNAAVLDDDEDDQSTVDVGTGYEQFVQGIYQALLKADGVENIDVRHNIKVTGKSGCKHQIDVYWEFKLAGQTYKTAIECKAFNSRVSIGRIRDFYGVVHDVRNLNGIFVTLVGFQSGARKYADHYGIALQELRSPTAEDWSGRVKTIVLQIVIVDATITKFEPMFSQSFLDTLDPNKPLVLSRGIQSDTKIISDEAGNPVLSRDDFRGHIPMTKESVANQKLSISLPNHTIEIGGTKIPIDGVNLIYDVHVETEEIRIDGESLVQAIIKDAQSGELKVVTNSGEVRTPRSE